MDEILSQWYWIMPNMVLFSKELTDKQKLLYCLISSLCAEKWYCRASNDYLWELLNADARTIRRNVSALQENWLIRTEVSNNKRQIMLSRVDKNVLGVGQKCPPEVGQKCPHNNIIYNNINNIYEDLFSNYYWKDKWIDTKACTKYLDELQNHWVHIDEIKQAMILYNCECRIKQDYKYVKKFETWIKEYQSQTEEQIEEALNRIVKQYKEKKKSDEKFSKSKPCKVLWEDLCNTFWRDRVNNIFKWESSVQNLLHFT